jgi:epoxyqueuosine reductase
MQFTYRNPQRSTDPQQVLHGAASLVVGLLDYRRRDRSRPPGTTARIARYASEDFYGQLRAGLGAIATHLEGAGRRARVVADSNALVDRNAAWLAGLGWYGKNTNLLVEGVGSWFVMGAVVTDAQLEPTAEPAADGCGTCTACLAGCPTGALVAPGVLDARRCIAWLVQSAEPIPAEHRAAVGDRIYGCDICQEVCPPNRVALGRRSPPPAGQDAEPWADVVWILQAADDELLERYGRWYIANRDPDVIRRTALVVLGNIGDGTDPTVVALIERYVSHPVPLLRAHAVWAARRLGLDELSAAAAADPDPAVRAELSAPTAAR